MVDLNLKREPSFNTFMKTELTCLFGNNDESMMLETPKGGHKKGFEPNPQPSDGFDAAILNGLLERTDSRNAFGQPLTRSKSKECLVLVNGAVAAAPAHGQAAGAQDGGRLTRSLSKESMGAPNQQQLSEVDLVRADSILGNLGFDLSDLLDGNFGAPYPPAEPKAPESVAVSKAPKRKSSSTNQSQGKKARTSKKEEDSDPENDVWINQNVRLTRGKYEGRAAFVLGKTSKKYQVQVEGVAYQLEFYGSMFVRPEDYKPAQPKRSRKKAVVDERQVSFGLTPSMDDISRHLDSSNNLR